MEEFERGSRVSLCVTFAKTQKACLGAAYTGCKAAGGLAAV